MLTLRRIALIHPDGSGFRRLTALGGDPSWSPDGKRIAFTHLDRAGDIFSEMLAPGSKGGEGQGISVINRDGTHLTRLTTRTGDRDPAWSRGGAYIAFTRGVNSSAIWIMNADGTNQHLLVKNADKAAWRPLHYLPEAR